MYDINRSNLLSIETMKMHLYNITALGILQKKTQEQRDTLLYKKRGLGIRNVFDETPYERFYQDSEDGMHIALLIGLCLPGLFIFLATCTQSFIRTFFEALMTFFPLGSVFLCIILISLPCICYKIYNMRIEESENQSRAASREIALKQFEEAERTRLLKEAKQLSRINEEISHLDLLSSRIEQQLANLYQQEILHPDYQDPQICGIMFQLFDTGRVHNLTEAMNLYEDLRWKAEMQSLLQSLVQKVDDMLSIVSNIEYYSRCTLENQKETHRLLNGVSMRMSQISESQEAVRINTDVLRANSETMLLLQEMDFIRRS